MVNEALVRLLTELDDGGYDFITVTPETHRRVLERRQGESAQTVRDVFGWSMPFQRELLAGPLMDALEEADAVQPAGQLLKSRLRVSSLGGRLFLHSAYPTTDENAVFFGPDTYRFARFLEAELREVESCRHLVDLGAGSGPGGITAAGLIEPERLTLGDVNSQALALAEANAAAAGIDAHCVEGDLDRVEGPIDLIIANPPFIADPLGRSYRDGGDMLGAGLSYTWAIDGAQRLRDGGTMLLYTGSPIVSGEDRLLSALAEELDELGCTLRYEELDPDIFGEELEQPPYRDAGVERIAAVAAVIRKF